MSIFRVFVSSTFSDFWAEREVLQQLVFPRLSKACRLKGSSFLGVDLRWGISPERQKHNQTMQTCLEEIERCQRLSPKPNFLILLGERYGWLPPPERIPDDLFQRLLKWFEKEGRANNKKLLEDWYKEDKNAVEPEWLLMPCHEVCPNDPEGFDRIASPLQKGLAEAAIALGLEVEEERLLLTASAMHQEAQRGFLSLPEDSAEHVFTWRRKIKDLNQLDEKTRANFQDNQGVALEALAESLSLKLGDRYIEQVADFAELKVQQPLQQPLSPYLQAFADHVFNALCDKIFQQIAETPERDEESIHRDFAKSRTEGIIGREAELDEIREYLSKPASGPHFRNAPGGMGKTSLLAKCVTELADENWVVRFAGASSRIGDPSTLLRSLWPEEQVRSRCKTAAQSRESARGFVEDALQIPYVNWPKRFNDAVSELEISKPEAQQQKNARLEGVLIDVANKRRDQLLADMTAGFMERRETNLVCYLEIIRNLRGGKLVLVIDALDQLPGSPDLAYLLDRLGRIAADGGPLKLPDNVWLIASQRDEQSCGLKGLCKKSWKAVIDTRLGLAGRILTDVQMAWMEGGWDACVGKPLVLKLALESALRLHSWEPTPSVKFGLLELISDLFDRLDDEHQHGLLGGRALAYLAQARHGVPEEVLIEALAADVDVAAWFEALSKKTEQPWSLERGLPPILWSRVQMDLEPYLMRRDASGSPALHFFHREFHEQAMDYVKEGHASPAKLAMGLARAAWRRLFGKAPFDLDLPPSLYRDHPDGWALGELPWLLEQAGLSGASQQLLELPAFIVAKLGIPGGVESLAADYDRQGDSEWAALFRCHYAALLLHPSPRLLFIQRAMELTETSPVRRATEQWLAKSGSDDFWVRDLLSRPRPLYELTMADRGVEFKDLADGRIAVWPANKSDTNSRTIRIVYPDQPKKPVAFLENPWHDDFDGKRKQGFVEELIALPDTSYWITRHSDGPLLVWRGEQCLAYLADVNFPPAKGEARQEAPTQKEHVGRTPAVKLIPEQGRSLLVVYEDGWVVRLRLPTSLDATEPMTPPVTLRSDDENCFKNLAEDNGCKMDDGKRMLRHVVQDGPRTVLVFTGSGAAIRVVIIAGNDAKQFYSETSVAGWTEPHRFSPYAEGCYAQVDATRVIQITADGERDMPLAFQVGDVIQKLWTDTEGGLLVLVGRDFPEQDAPWSLQRFKPDLNSNLLSPDWLREGLRNKTPKLLESPRLLCYLTDDGLKVLRLDTFKEIAFDIHQMPNGLRTLDDGSLLGWAGGVLYTLDLNNGKVWSCNTGHEIRDAFARPEDILVAHDDGHLRAWSRNCVREDEGLLAKIDHVAALPNGRVLSCATDRLIVWRDEDEQPRPQVVWQANAEEAADQINAVTFFTHSDEAVTYGNRFIRVWAFGEAGWRMSGQVDWPASLGLLRAPIVAVLPVNQVRILFEYGVGIDRRGAKIGLFHQWNGVWSAKPLQLPRVGDWKYHQLLTPVMSNGDVLFETLSDDQSEGTRYTAYNLNSETAELLAVDDPKLRAWVETHKEVLEEKRRIVIESLENSAKRVAIWGDEELSTYANSLSNAPDVLRGLEEAKKGFAVPFSGYPATSELALKENAILGGWDLSQLGVFDQTGMPPIATYHDNGKFRLWVNHLSTSGRFYLTDSDQNLRILQLMRGHKKVAARQ